MIASPSAKEVEMSISWTGVYPAATTQFAPDLSIDIDATQKVLDALIRDGVHGQIGRAHV